MKPTEDLVSPPIPENEQQRLQNLKSYGIIDRELEEEYDDIAQLAAEMC